MIVKKIFVAAMCVSFVSFAAFAKDVKSAAPAAAAEKKICEKTGKPCTGDMKNAAHDCKKGDKECSKNTAKAPAKK